MRPSSFFIWMLWVAVHSRVRSTYKPTDAPLKLFSWHDCLLVRFRLNSNSSNRSINL